MRNTLRRGALAAALLASSPGCYLLGMGAQMEANRQASADQRAEALRSQEQQRSQLANSFHAQSESQETTFENMRQRVDLMEAEFEGWIERMGASARAKGSPELSATLRAHQSAKSKLAEVDSEHANTRTWATSLSQPSPTDLSQLGTSYSHLNQKLGLVVSTYSELRSHEYTIERQYKK